MTPSRMVSIYKAFDSFSKVIKDQYTLMGMTKLRPLDEVNTHDEVILNDDETSHH